mgnify:CR=1 FL=1
MSRDTDLQEMEVGTAQSKTAVNAGAKAADPMPNGPEGAATPGQGSVEDLGGPTPDNYKPDDDSAKLKTDGLKTVKDIVNKGAKPAMPMEKSKMSAEEVETEEEVIEEQDVVAEEETTEEEVVSEEETTEEEVVAEAPEFTEINIDEDVEALLGEEELSEEFKEKAKTIFEAALTSKVGELKEALEARYETALLEEVAEIKSALTERVDSYLEYVSQEWMTENQLAVEEGLKTEMTESFLTGMKSLFEEHYVSIPEDKYDVLESMVEKLDDMETKLNEQIEKNVSLNKRLSESVADGIFESVSEGLAATQKDKLASLAESVEFESEDQYREKLETLKEAYFAKKASSTAKTETLSEGVSNGHESYSPSMAAYIRSLGSTSK